MSVFVEFHGEIAVVTLDNPPVNSLGQAVRQGLLDAVNQIAQAPGLRAVVLRGKGGSFCAGADVREFDADPTLPFLPDVLNAIEGSIYPWIAAIDGFALGGGLELALACHYRIAHHGATIGFPEVKLGVIPGAGGTVRLPRLIPADRALAMIAEGDMISAHEAYASGIVSQVVVGDLINVAFNLAEKVCEHALPIPLSQRDPVEAGTPVALKLQKDRIRRRARGQIAPAVAADVLETSISEAADVAFQAERASFLKLKSGAQAAALRHIFFAERASGRIARAKGAKPRPLRHIGVVGGGTMGAGIAVACLLSGLTVTLAERDADALEAGLDRISTELHEAYRRGKLDRDSLQVAQEDLRGTTSFAGFADCDLVIEAVFEDMDAKKQVFAELDLHVRDDAVLATNTSYLDVDEIAAATLTPSRVIGLHFFSPAHIMKLLEVVVSENASAEVLATGLSLGQRLKKTIAASGVCEGFIGNRVMSAYRREADYLIEDGALPEEVDKAMIDFGFPMGVFAMQDLAGLDIAWAMRKRRAAERPEQERYVAIADRLCEAGRLGRKAGKGWYDYTVSKTGTPDPEVTKLIQAESQQKGIHRRSFSSAEIMERLLAAMQTEGLSLVEDGIAASTNVVDVVMVNGYGFPRWRGGPMFMMVQS
nr:3-hydroxyacyl-CoA dehydrogenase NAD-binding domain-containing protein [Dinoroseobacter sp.]